MKNKTLFKEGLVISFILTLLIACSAPPMESSTAMPLSTPVVLTTVPPTLTLLPPEVSATSAEVTDPNIVTQTLTLDAYQYVMECRGQGDPTILLLGGRAATWESIQTEFNTLTRTCVFEHAGSRSTPLTAEEIAMNMHTLLKDAEIQGPYVVVGFSVGGYIARLFADLYPDEVASMALLESSHEDQNARFLTALPSESPDDCQELKDYRAELQGAHVLPIGSAISLDFDASADRVRATKADLGNLPLVVLTAGRSEWPECFPPEVREDLDHAWQTMQDDLASLSTNSTQLVAEESGYSFAEQPEMVVDAIHRVVQATQTGAVP